MTLRIWGLIGTGVVFALMVSQAFASEPASPAAHGVTDMPATQSQDAPAPQSHGAKDDPGLPKSPRPRPAAGGDASGAAQSEQCRWLGTRIISLLSRDDAMTAKDFNPFYLRFGCPEAHLSKAFGCVVGGGGQVEGEELASRVDRCWVDPKGGRKSKDVLGDEIPPEMDKEKSGNGGT